MNKKRILLLVALFLLLAILIISSKRSKECYNTVAEDIIKIMIFNIDWYNEEPEKFKEEFTNRGIRTFRTQYSRCMSFGIFK